jgi:hypothetical protein
MIIGGVALVATLITNYFVRGHLERRVETIWTKPIYPFYMPDSVFLKNISYVDTIGDSLHTTITQLAVFKHYDWYNDHHASEFYKDSTKLQNKVSLVIYTTDKKGNQLYVGVFKTKEKQARYDFREVTNVYVASSGNDTLRYEAKKKLVYTVPPSNWITGFSFPRVKTARIIYIPPREYDMIPKSLIKKLPF